MIPLFKVYMARDVVDFVKPVLHSGYIGEGEKVKQFEHEIGRMIGNPNVAMVNSGTSAIVMALRLAGIGRDDLVLSTPMTCMATNEAILQFGAHIVWADILQDGTVNPFSVEEKLREFPEVKAVMVVDWGGTPCMLKEIKTAIGDRNIPIIEDACQSIGSVYCNHLIGHAENGADYVCLSFQAIKYLTTADGGAVIVPPDKLKEAQLLRWFGMDRTKSIAMRCEQDPPAWGYKFQSNDVAAAIGLANLQYLPGLLRAVRRNARRYNHEFADIDGVAITGPFKTDRQPNYWLYTLLVDDVSNFTRYMAGRGIEVSKAHVRNDTKTIFADYQVELPGVTFFDDRHICIPVGWWLSDSDVEEIVQAVKEYGHAQIHSEEIRDTRPEAVAH
jgi:dTDP-4-amino-4,6-dideoxygalactose transaminase